MKKSNLETVEFLIQKYGDLDFEGLRPVLSKNIISHITNKNGGTDIEYGPDNLIRRQEALKYQGVDLNLTILQSVPINPHQVMTLVHVQAKLNDTHFENYAGFLFTLENSLITEMWMVEAKPEGSDNFWKTGKENA